MSEPIMKEQTLPGCRRLTFKNLACASARDQRVVLVVLVCFRFELSLMILNGSEYIFLSQLKPKEYTCAYLYQKTRTLFLPI